MKIQKNKFVLQILILGFLSLVSKSFAQNESVYDISRESRTIYFEEGIPLDVLSNMEMKNLTLKVTNSKGEVLANLNEISMGEFRFDTPGDYSIELKSEHETNSEHDGCNHFDHDRTVQIRVLPYSLKFDFDQLTFSSELLGGKDMTGVSLTLPVEVKLFSGSTLNVENLKVLTAGINTNVEGTTTGQTTLKSGTNLISYQLKGAATKNTYIMFDFFDMNGRVHSFGYPTKLN